MTYLSVYHFCLPTRLPTNLSSVSICPSIHPSTTWLPRAMIFDEGLFLHLHRARFPEQLTHRRLTHSSKITGHMGRRQSKMTQGCPLFAAQRRVRPASAAEVEEGRVEQTILLC